MGFQISSTAAGPPRAWWCYLATCPRPTCASMTPTTGYLAQHFDFAQLTVSSRPDSWSATTWTPPMPSLTSVHSTASARTFCLIVGRPSGFSTAPLDRDSRGRVRSKGVRDRSSASCGSQVDGSGPGGQRCAPRACGRLLELAFQMRRRDTHWRCRPHVSWPMSRDQLQSLQVADRPPRRDRASRRDLLATAHKSQSPVHLSGLARCRNAFAVGTLIFACLGGAQ